MGAKPFLIDWGESISPAQTAPKGCSLVGLECHAPDTARAEALLRAVGLGRLGAGVEVKRCRGGPGHLVAELDTPKGRVQLGLPFEQVD